MAMKKKTLFGILGGAILAVCGAGIISAVAFANAIEEKYAPKFNADELANTEYLLSITARARDAEHKAIFDECKTIAMNSDKVKKLQREIDDLIAIATLDADSLAIVCPGFSVWSFSGKLCDLENKIDMEIEKTINETPVMRELNTRYENYKTQRLYLNVARDEYNKWRELPRKERIKQNLQRRRYQKQDRIIQHYCNNVKSY